ncbi:MAG: hypothetical protein ACOYT9_02105 [Patescibacteria group bacterium]
MDFNEKYVFEHKETHINEIIRDMHRDRSPFNNLYREAIAIAQRNRGKKLFGDAQIYLDAITYMAMTAASFNGYGERDTARAAQILRNMFTMQTTVEGLSENFLYPNRIEDVGLRTDTHLSPEEVVETIYPVLKTMKRLDDELISRSN